MLLMHSGKAARSIWEIFKINKTRIFFKAERTEEFHVAQGIKKKYKEKLCLISL